VLTQFPRGVKEMSLETKINENGSLETVLTVKSVFIYDQEEQEEDFPLRLKLFKLYIAGSKKEYLFFIKEEGKRIYYIPRQRGYMKLWKEGDIIMFSIMKKALKVISSEGESQSDWQSIHTELNIEGPLKEFLEYYYKEIIEYILEFLEYP